MKFLIVGIFLASLGQASPGEAQPNVQPRFEIGVDGGAFTAIGGGVFGLPLGGALVSVNLTNQIAIDLIGDIVPSLESDGLYGLYGIQLRRVMREAARNRAAIFVSGGAVGTFEYDSVPERRSERPDGSIVIYRRYTDAELSPPAALSAGIGLHRVLAPFAAFRADAQALLGFGGGLLLRGTLGIQMPIGRRYVPAK